MERLGEAIIRAAREEGRNALSEREARSLLALYGIPSVSERASADEAGCRAAVASLQAPYVVKVDSPSIIHKTEVGGVVTGCRDLAEVLAARERILASARQRGVAAMVSSVLVQEMVQGAVECFIGVKRDPQFGPVVAFGLGGVWVELLDEVALRVPPITAAEARRMIRETRASKALGGLRGRPPCDIDGVAEAILSVSQLALDWQDEIAEIDINPLMALPDGIKTVDALVLLRGGDQP